VNLDGPQKLGVNPGISDQAAREDQLMHAVIVHDCKVQIAVAWDIVNGADIVPHAPLLQPSGNSTLI
jgi:hypothetical protein